MMFDCGCGGCQAIAQAKAEEKQVKIWRRAHDLLRDAHIALRVAGDCGCGLACARMTLTYKGEVIISERPIWVFETPGIDEALESMPEQIAHYKQMDWRSGQMIFANRDAIGYVRETAEDELIARGFGLEAPPTGVCWIPSITIIIDGKLLLYNQSFCGYDRGLSTEYRYRSLHPKELEAQVEK